MESEKRRCGERPYINEPGRLPCSAVLPVLRLPIFNFLDINNKSEPISDWIKVRIILIWWRWWERPSAGLRPAYCFLGFPYGPLRTTACSQVHRTCSLTAVPTLASTPTNRTDCSHKKTGTRPVFLCLWWRWWESNPRPKAFPQEFLRAQLMFLSFAFSDVH